ncbi:helix-turn-helix domain-containing protein [Thermocoleostomius sinensis]|uniref:AraC family transcriptional regulator n=1 Tax=Thermocoleostomius sinensis A174 TaxID=2016057 RepID=A0A9E8ZFN3_9CYAN|nr:AraC family transcriptional regulator [Thermocoleostomius sinensis]WAL62182.1 AraC family transcriptional regulator [Thermocoleostomius sinensis A174]
MTTLAQNHSTGNNLLTLNQTDLQILLDQAHQQGECIYQHMDQEQRINLPSALGEGCGRDITLRHGLTIHIRNARLWQDIAVEQQHEPTFPLTAKFYLSGSSRMKTQRVPGIEPDYEETAGCHYLYHLPNLTEVEEWRAHIPIQVVMVYAHNDFFRSFSPTQTLPPSLQKLMKGSGQFHQSLGKVSPTMMQVLRQIIHCPYQGLTQQLYLESKALELIALQFACLDASPPSTNSVTLQPDDLERLHYARDFLIAHATNPPSLVELARQAGLNDRKLKQGFRQVFGTTVFGCLQDYRMQQARHLLQQPHLTIAQVAATVGYRNPEAFSTAFRRKFAMSPKAYQLQHCRSTRSGF